MRTSNSSSCAIRAALMLAVGVLAWEGPSLAQTKGTRTVVTTPYSRQVEPTVAEVAEMKKRATKERTATISESKIGNRFIAFSTCSGAKVVGSPVYELKGLTADKPVALDLADIEELRVDAVEPDRSLFTVTRFPAVTPAALLADQPSYTGLREHALAKSEVWVSTKNPAGTVCLVEEADEPGKWIVFAHLGKLPVGGVVTFGYAWRRDALWKGREVPIWWAVPSVARDTSYPYKFEAILKH